MNGGRDRFAVVELLGVPGVGKTTVARALAARGSVDVQSRYRSWRNVPPYVMSAIALAPALVSALTNGSSWRDRRRLVRLRSSASMPGRSMRRGRTAFVFDQGPVFLLKQLADEDEPGEPVAGRRRNDLRRWAHTLDLAIVLEASDDVLLRRIRERDKDHPVKRATLDEAGRALAFERRSLTSVLDELARAGPVRIEHVDTTDASIAQVTDAVMRSISAIRASATQV